ncbi:UNVERIFIED_CONTAM: hypothetical protein PYX00_010275 [Menopon gallinae]|uniref:Chromo domain-containing protein n=1 Tax=Menopon gallinae TaxID=328185 RepID=A0AAW2HET2_9NEOP
MVFFQTEQLIEMDGAPEQVPPENESAPAAASEEPADEGPAPEDAITAPETPSTEVVKAAQEDILQLDVLVCGKCQNVYHFIEAFSEHKNSNECDIEAQVFKSNTNESTPQLWAFLLWKASRTKDSGNSNSPDWASNSWNLYQRWCKLPDDVRKTWVEAGKSLETLTHLGRTKIDLNRSNTSKVNKPLKTTMTPQQLQQHQQTLLELQKELEDDETEMMSTLGLVRGSKSSPAGGKGKKAGTNDVDPLGTKEDETAKNSTNRIVRKSLKPKGDDDEDSEEEEYVVEKIVAKRVNPKTKKPEYLLKWEGYPSDHNTWEPVQNMGTCTKLVQEFERNLARQKARKALEASKMPKNVIKIEELVQNSSPQNTSSRPVRTSAKKALDQVKEWVNMGTKRKYESEEESDADDPKPKKQDNELTTLFKKKVLGNSNAKTPVLVANSKGVVRVDPEQVPNLSSGVYILSSQSGLIKVDDPTAQKLTEAMKGDAKKITEKLNPKVMINETEIRKIPAKSVQPKIRLFKKDQQQTGIIKKESNLAPSVKIIQKSSMNKLPLPLRLTTPKINQQQILSKLGSSKLATSTPKQIIIGQKKTRPLPGPIPSPLRPPVLKPKVTIKTAPTAAKKTTQQIRLGNLINKNNKERVEQADKFSDDDFDGGLPDEFPKEDEPIAPPSPTRPLTLCPLTGEVLGKAEGEKTPPAEEESILPEIEDDGMMRVEMSPGGTIRQIITKPQQQKKQQPSVLQKKPQSQPVTKVRPAANQELISIEGEDGIIYQMTPEQQQMLINNGTFRVDSRIIQDDTTADSEHTEIVIQNGQIIQRTIVQGNEEDNSQDGSTILMHNESSNDQIILQTSEGGVYVTQEAEGGGGAVLTLDSAVQEAVATGTGAAEEGSEEMEEATEESQQMVAQIVQAESPTPGGGPRKVVLLLPDGSLIHTEMDEEQYQALDFEK